MNYQHLTINITELNQLIYEGAKLICDNFGVTQKNTNRTQKLGWEIWLGM